MTERRATEDSVQAAVGTAKFSARCESLERRLADGYLRIEEASLLGADVTQWESFWIRLLREYEDVCRELEVAA